MKNKIQHIRNTGVNKTIHIILADESVDQLSALSLKWRGDPPGSAVVPKDSTEPEIRRCIKRLKEFDKKLHENRAIRKEEWEKLSTSWKIAKQRKPEHFQTWKKRSV